MMLPRVVRKLRKFSIYVSVYIMLTIFMFSPVAQVYSNYILPRENYDKMILGEGNSQITDMEIIINNPNIKKEVRPSEAGSPYTPITSASGSGDTFNPSP
ncbi:MAG: hypothetical protein HGN29_15430 [Asgard group archaeon]|nr:hypothetical protein [Asgard group archaeon]